MDNINQGKGTIGKLLHDDAFYVNLNRAVLEFQDIGARVGKGNGTIAPPQDPKLYDDLRGRDHNVKASSPTFAREGNPGQAGHRRAVLQQATEILAKFNSTTEKLDKIAGDIRSGTRLAGQVHKG